MSPQGQSLQTHCFRDHRTLLALIPENLSALFSGNDNLQIAIIIKIGGDNVQSNTRSLGSNVLTKGLELFIPSVIHHNRDVVGTRIPTVVPINALSCN